MHVLSLLNRLFRHVLVAVAVLVCLRLSIIMLCKGVSKVTCNKVALRSLFSTAGITLIFCSDGFCGGRIFGLPGENPWGEEENQPQHSSQQQGMRKGTNICLAVR